MLKCFGDILRIFSFPLTWEPIEAKFQNATPPINHSQKFSNFSWIFFSVLTKLRLRFWKSEKWNVNDFFVVVNMGPYGSENLKTLLLLQILVKCFQTWNEFCSHWSSQNYVWPFLEIEFPIFSDFILKISNSTSYSKEKPKSSIIWKMSNRGVKLEWNLGLEGTSGIHMLLPFTLNVFLGSFGAFAFFLI